jgi:hypothetical protein
MEIPVFLKHIPDAIIPVTLIATQTVISYVPPNLSISKNLRKGLDTPTASDRVSFSFSPKVVGYLLTSPTAAPTAEVMFVENLVGVRRGSVIANQNHCG